MSGSLSFSVPPPPPAPAHTSSMGPNPLPASANSPPSFQTHDQEMQALKRRICALELENAHMLSKISKKP